MTSIPMKSELHILVTNDDGIRAPGIQALSRALARFGRITVVAPSSEKSAVSHALTLQTPLRIQEIAPGHFSVDGTPADCILVAMNKILAGPPTLVVSGINAGSNLGDDVNYSGTVAGAREGSMYGIPAVAFSLKLGGDMDYAPWAERAAEICAHCLENPLPLGIFLNVNFPAVLSDGIRITRLSRKFARSSLFENNDPRGKKYYWIGGGEPDWEREEGTDFDAVDRKMVSVTPLHLDFTDYASFDKLKPLEKMSYMPSPVRRSGE
jgi:5'-nucleotidase